MRTLLVTATLAGTLLLAAGSASAQEVGWSVGVGPGGVGVSIGTPYYAGPAVTWAGAVPYGAYPPAPYPPAVYAAPVYAPRVYAPPVYAAPVYAPRGYGSPVYVSPGYAPPVVYRRAPVVVAPGWVGAPYYGGPRHGHWGGHGGRHWR